MLQKATNSLKLEHMNFEAKQPRFKCCIYYVLQALFGDITLSLHLEFILGKLCIAMPPTS